MFCAAADGSILNYDLDEKRTTKVYRFEEKRIVHQMIVVDVEVSDSMQSELLITVDNSGYVSVFKEMILLQSIRVSNGPLWCLQSFENGNKLFAAGADANVSLITFDSSSQKFMKSESRRLNQYEIRGLARIIFKGKEKIVSAGKKGVFYFQDTHNFPVGRIDRFCFAQRHVSISDTFRNKCKTMSETNIVITKYTNKILEVFRKTLTEKEQAYECLAKLNFKSPILDVCFDCSKGNLLVTLKDRYKIFKLEQHATQKDSRSLLKEVSSVRMNSVLLGKAYTRGFILVSSSKVDFQDLNGEVEMSLNLLEYQDDENSSSYLLIIDFKTMQMRKIKAEAFSSQGIKEVDFFLDDPNLAVILTSDNGFCVYNFSKDEVLTSIDPYDLPNFIRNGHKLSFIRAIGGSNKKFILCGGNLGAFLNISKPLKLENNFLTKTIAESKEDGKELGVRVFPCDEFLDIKVVDTENIVVLERTKESISNFLPKIFKRKRYGGNI
eukprot:snap_masked-scaffold_8-processed-gene-0.17-mRNA-1 protein AED:1.00 eAED:1.00 QI:0/0/0/0/1/1/2/0/493